jgi:hypothetical protein
MPVQRLKRLTIGLLACSSLLFGMGWPGVGRPVATPSPFVTVTPSPDPDPYRLTNRIVRLKKKLRAKLYQRGL